MKTLDANRLFEMELASHYILCIELLLAVAEGHEIVSWSEHDKRHVSIGDDGEERPLLPPFDEPTRSDMLKDRTRTVETLASFEGNGSKTGRFLLLIGDHRVMVGVEERATNLDKTMVLRMDGAKGAREPAKALLAEFMDDKHGPMFLSGGRILGHGTLRLKYRIANLIEIVSMLVWIPFCVSLGCVLFASTSLPSLLGLLGWINCILLGLWLGLVTAPYIFARERPPSQRSRTWA